MTLETAKALKEAGWDKETNLLMFEYGAGRTERILSDEADGLNAKTYPSPSLEELLAVMPARIEANKIFYDEVTNEKILHDFSMVKFQTEDGIKFSFKYMTQVMDDDFSIPFIEINSNPTEAVAQLWLKLRKEGVV